MEKILNVNTVEELAISLSTSKNMLEALANNLNKYYKTKRIFKNGKRRLIDEPQGDLKKVQKLINKNLLQGIKLPDTIQGSRKKGSIRKNAEMHVGQKIVGNLDIKDFFPSIKSTRVKEVFERLGCSSAVSELLTKLTTWKGRLPQGVSTSSAIANLMLLGMERRFRNLCNIHGIRYSFYVDDIAISGNQRVEKLKNLFCKIIRQEGFQINPDKIKFQDRSKRQMVTKLIVNRKPNVPKEYRRRLRAIIYNCRKYGPSTQTRNNTEAFKMHLAGKISYVLSINKEAGLKLREEFQKIDWEA